jgi:hypothetical protein
MKGVTRRQAIGLAAATGTGVVAGSAAKSAQVPKTQPKSNREPSVPSKATAENCGPREMFAVVDADGNLKRGLHAVSARSLEAGVYEVLFARDVRRGAYLVSTGGPGYEGVPLSAVASVMGRASDPRGVLVFTSDLTGAPQATGFHLLVICPEGYA